VPEATLFTVHERVESPMRAVVNPADLPIFGNHFGELTYYADYCGIGKKYGPKSILEIGVRYGYSGISLCAGSLMNPDNQGETVEYYGMDWEGVGHPAGSPADILALPPLAVAQRNFLTLFGMPIELGFLVVPILNLVNTQVDEWPEEVTGRTFDLINVDGDHSFVGALKDCWNCWPLLNPGGLMLIDDMCFPEVNEAVRGFVCQLEGEGHDPAVAVLPERARHDDHSEGRVILLEWWYKDTQYGLQVRRGPWSARVDTPGAAVYFWLQPKHWHWYRWRENAPRYSIEGQFGPVEICRYPCRGKGKRTWLKEFRSTLTKIGGRWTAR
jgi:hypothetical protein